MNRVWVLAALAAASLGRAQVSDMTVYDHSETGFEFSYPRDWQIKKMRDHIALTIPFADVNRSGLLEVYGVTFSGEVPTWQAVQVNAAKDLKREIERQWQEEVLTVPMLMARTRWTADEAQFTSDSALIYADTRRKLLFRLESRTEDFERTNAAFRQVLQSLRLADGRLPKPFDPSKPQSENLRKPDTDGKSGVWRIERPKATAPVKGDQTFETVAGNVPVIFRFAGPWKPEAKDNEIAFTLPEVAGEVRVRVFSALEGDPPGRALLKASGASLGAFSKVVLREEKGPLDNRAGSQYATIWREGTAESGPMASFDAVISFGDHYALVRWTGGEAKAARAMRDRVLELVNTASIEPKP